VMLRDVAHSLGITVAGDELIDQQLDMITTRISDALPKVTRGLGRAYKAEKARR
jgi:hypothetical protein